MVVAVAPHPGLTGYWIGKCRDSWALDCEGCGVAVSADVIGIPVAGLPSIPLVDTMASLTTEILGSPAFLRGSENPG